MHIGAKSMGYNPCIKGDASHVEAEMRAVAHVNA
jgi:hypothetical protein